jgi:hypothetical protein
MTSGSDTYLYTLSDVGMKAIEVNDFSTTLGSMLFPPQYYPWSIIYAADSGGGVVSAPVVGTKPAQ